MKKSTWIPIVAIAAAAAHRARAPPLDKINDCRIADAEAWAIKEGSTGLTWYFATDAHPEPIELGWGYDGSDICALARNRGRYLVSWGWADSWGGNPELRIAVVENGRRINHRKVATGGWDIHPVSIEPLRDGGWRVHYRDNLDDDVATDTVRVDRDGN